MHIYMYIYIYIFFYIFFHIRWAKLKDCYIYYLFWVTNAMSTYARSPAITQHATVPHPCLHLLLPNTPPSYLVLVLVFRGIRHCTLWLLYVGALEGHCPFAKISDKRDIYAVNHGVRWPQNGKINDQKYDKFYFEMRRFGQGMLEVIFYNNQCNI